MFGCRHASTLLCGSGLRKCNKIKTFRVFKIAAGRPSSNKNLVFGCKTASPGLNPLVGGSPAEMIRLAA
jgi:hypothetical protein